MLLLEVSSLVQCHIFCAALASGYGYVGGSTACTLYHTLRIDCPRSCVSPELNTMLLPQPFYRSSTACVCAASTVIPKSGMFFLWIGSLQITHYGVQNSTGYQELSLAVDLGDGQEKVRSPIARPMH